ncbi:MAG: prepilin-type N-terminal cleavage/methylation domain-containing protein, partial [Sulfurimonas sp.]|nr:prepilin-type N-terminal cleavage/methylation domain-containing protein [Sulfurimonas sp.]
MRRCGFTLLELIFVIVVMGILAKFGVEFLNQAYRGFIASSINNTLQAQSAAAVESVASRLQYRIKDSVIGRKSSDASFLPIGSASGSEYNILEWVATDIENLRGNSLPNWSGIIDLYHPSSTSNILVSPGTDTTAINTMIQVLSHNSGTTINNAALYFIGSDSDIVSGYGWDGNLTTINTQNGAMHPINSVGGQPTQFTPAVGNFTGVDVFEYYQLAWTA